MAIYVKGSGKNKKYIAKGTIPLGGHTYQNYHRVMVGATNKKDAQAMELEFKKSFSLEKSVTKKKSYTLKEFIDFYDSEKNRQIKSSTKQSNFYISKFYIPLFDVEIHRITSEQIKKILDEKIESGLEESYVNKALEYITKIFNFGLKKGIILANPAQKVERYRNPDALVKEMKFYTPAEFKKFIQFFPKERNESLDYVCYVVVNCLYFLGLRINECLALKREDINIEKATVRVNKTVFRNVDGHSYLVTSPKTKNSIRTILIPTALLGILEEYLEWFDNLYGINSKCFLFGIDHPIHPKNIRKRVKKSAIAAGLPTIRLHDFRHSHASLLANSGMPINAIASRLGHTISECQKTYIHLFNESEKRLVDAIDQEFKGD